MRFFEYESREIVRRAGIPTTKFGFAKTADEARAIAADIGGPVVIKSQVLTGGRMKAGGVQFADTPDEAATHAEHVVRRHFSTRKPCDDYEAKELVASLGVTGSDLNRLTPIVARLARMFLEFDMTLAEIN